MIRRSITLPELGLIAGTRGALGLGIGLLIADKLAPESRRAVGWTLLAVGIISTIPLAAQFFFGDRMPADDNVIGGRLGERAKSQAELEAQYGV